jgi:hypothetical protein
LVLSAQTHKSRFPFFLNFELDNFFKMKIQYLFSPHHLYSLHLVIKINKKKKMQSNHLKEEMVSYTLDSITRNNFVVYDDNIKGPVRQ